MKRIIILPLLLAASCTLPAEEYVAADRATYEALAPQLELLADEDPENDPSFAGINGVALDALLESWMLRIETAEEGFAK
jgi:hypothetical protein